jgi:hypothetical protein
MMGEGEGGGGQKELPTLLPPFPQVEGRYFYFEYYYNVGNFVLIMKGSCHGSK